VLTKGFRLGRVIGFDIRIDSSWFILFALILWSFSTLVFPASAPGFPPVMYPIMGLAGTLLFFASLLAHELAHAVVARMKGIPVDGITLFLFGGMAHTRTEAETAGDEFQIAVVGPLMSLFVAVLLAGVWYVGGSLGWSTAVLAVAQYIAALNIILAVFNLLPGFPLDGGRLFRAAIWKVTGDVRLATKWASFGGRWLGIALIALGAWMAFSGNVIGGLWLVFIGWFLRNAAISSYQQHMLLSVLGGVRAADAMSSEPETVPADASVQELMNEYVMRRRHSAYPVLHDGVPLGIVTLDALRVVPRAEWSTRTARDLMVPASAITVRPEQHLLDVIDTMKATKARRVLVVGNGTLLGIISASDIGFWLQRARQETGRNGESE
jgi:Zn-dependent protease/predicted transcriptional regulator